MPPPSPRTPCDPPPIRARWDIAAVCGVLALLILALDIVAPLGVACGALYVTVVMFTLLADSPKLTWRISAILSLFAAVGLLQDLHDKGPIWVILANRAVAIFLIWMTAALGVRLLRMKRQVYEHGQQLERLNAELLSIARYDALTGIANRRFFDERLHQEFLRASRDRVPISLLMIDVDFFKNFNDLYGHLAGDACLARVAQAIQSNVRRPADLVARYGGEEFAVILPGTGVTGASERAEAIRTRIAALQLDTQDPGRKAGVTVSVGVSTLQPSDEGATEKKLIEAADKAMYSGKIGGRNSVRIAA